MYKDNPSKQDIKQILQNIAPSLKFSMELNMFVDEFYNEIDVFRGCINDLDDQMEDEEEQCVTQDWFTCTDLWFISNYFKLQSKFGK